MSLPFLSFSCSNCEYHATDLVCSGQFSYEGPSGIVSIKKGLGWCNYCSDIVSVEILPSVKRAEELKSDIADKMQRINQCRDRLEQSRSWIKKLFKSPVNLPSEIQDLQWQCKYKSMEMRDEQQRIKLLESRKTPPRCLSCGTTDCLPLPEIPQLPEPQYPLFSSETPGQAVKIGFKHPGCGGNLLVEWSDVWVNMKSKHRIYDIEGRFIRSEDTRFG